MPDVTIHAFCERAQRQVALTVPLAEASAFFERQKTKQHSADEFRQALALEDAKDNFPDLIVYYKGKYVVHTSVLPSKESTILVLLKALTKSPVFGYLKKVRRTKNSSNNGKREYAPSVLRIPEVSNGEIRST